MSMLVGRHMIEVKIALRYLFARKREHFVSLLSLISISGVAIGVMALVVVLAVMSGFDRELKDKIVGSFAHITVESPEGITDYDKLTSELDGFPHVKAAAPYIQAQVLSSAYNKFFPLSVRGVELESEKKVTRINDYIVEGDPGILGNGTCVIGKELALQLGLAVGDKLPVYSPFTRSAGELEITAIFKSGMYDYDAALVFVNMSTAQKLFDMEKMAAGISIKLDDLYRADKVKLDISRRLNFRYKVLSWTDRNRNFFAALKLEKITMFIILALIVLVACFNIISTLIVMVVRRTKDIGILRSIGVGRKSIGRIFTLVGLLIGIGGTFSGAAMGLILCFMLKKYQFIKLPADIYYIQTLPVYVRIWPDITVIVGSALLIIFFSTIYPARRASKIIPADALRYE